MGTLLVLHGPQCHVRESFSHEEKSQIEIATLIKYVNSLNLLRASTRSLSCQKKGGGKRV